ncbi:MAG: lipoyl(octanoyl) transferase LipB [Bdellovibrionales bacterium]|nr:lipoyl(octanoyl) transferase LipB [Bdellovibrionales bacterium]
MKIESLYAGLVDYQTGLQLQTSALERLRKDEELRGVVIGLEHMGVVTLGVRGQIAADPTRSDISVSEELLRARGYELHKTTRGGQATLHNPGQLVIYPCMNLRTLGMGAKDYVTLVQTTTLKWLRQLGLELVKCGQNEPGLFVPVSGVDRKIAAFGFKISQGFTSHGLAINVQNDLSAFDLIRTCGVSKQPVTSFMELGIQTPTLESLFKSWLEMWRSSLDQQGSHISCSNKP